MRLKLFLLSLVFVSFSNVNAQTAINIKNAWGDIDNDLSPWVYNSSRPNKIKKGLEGRHISLWASHGKYFDSEKGIWRWQRPNLFCTNEDLFTQTIVVPYLIPMLERAGAYVFSPRERDLQKNEIIIDNDTSIPSGSTLILSKKIEWKTSKGFKIHSGNYSDNENPFFIGTSLITKAEKRKRATDIIYIPYLNKKGNYAVYISYPKIEDAVDDVHYTVCHKGIETEFVVNQQIGYGTWVYLGTFEFGTTPIGDNTNNNCVIISTSSKHKGHIGIDAVRFGGGMGNIQRNGITSGVPRCLEGARYYCQWAGAPYSVYSDKMGTNDYADDINARSLMSNWLGGSSCYMPLMEGKGIPFEMTLAVHSDAGYQADFKSIHGSLAIATTNFNDCILNSGISRYTSLDLASQLLNNLNVDMTRTFGTWGKRYLWDRNYSETRIPEVPSAILETLSHQSFPDMKIGQHPYGKFTIARSIYKTILSYICEQHGQKFIIEPLAPRDFHIELKDDNIIELSWSKVVDTLDVSSTPNSFNIYTSIGKNGFDNGKNIKGTSLKLKLEPGMQYNFRVTACNEGGESFPTETLSAYISYASKGTILVVNGFERLSAPLIVENDSIQGFDIKSDEGVQMGIYAGWCGSQINFNKKDVGGIDERGLGFSNNELEGEYIAGNNFDYVIDHVRAIASSKNYSVVSSSLSSLVNRKIELEKYAMIDLAFGLQKDDGQLGIHFKTFSSAIQSQLQLFASQGGAILSSGSFIGSDMLLTEEKFFLSQLLKVSYDQTKLDNINNEISGLGLKYEIFNTFNDQHYAATHPEVLTPSVGGICAMQYSNGKSAAVGYKGIYSCFTMGFPFECIIDDEMKDKIMQGIIAYLLNK